MSPSHDIFDHPGNSSLFEAVLSRRVMAFIIDFVLLLILTVFFSTIIFVFGIATFGLAWLLLPAVFPFAVIVYIALTMGSEQSATPGMRAVGLQALMTDGRKPYMLIALFHTGAFYVSISALTPFILLVGLFTRRQRLLHDYVSGLLFVNKDAARDILPSSRAESGH